MIAMNTQTHQDFKVWAGLKHSGRGPVHSNDNFHYWIEDGSIVTLDVINRTGINVEFSINGSTNHHIWFSQLGEAFFDVETLDLWGGQIFFKDGRKQLIAVEYDNNPDAFADAVRGKRFKVEVKKDGCLFRFDRDMPGDNYGERKQLILDLLEQGKVQDALKYLRAAQGYHFFEV